MSEVNGICDLMKEIVTHELTEGGQIALFIKVSPHWPAPFHDECHTHRHMERTPLKDRIDALDDHTPPAITSTIYLIADRLFDLGIETIRKKREKVEPLTPYPTKTSSHSRPRSPQKQKEEGEVISI